MVAVIQRPSTCLYGPFNHQATWGAFSSAEWLKWVWNVGYPQCIVNINRIWQSSTTLSLILCSLCRGFESSVWHLMMIGYGYFDIVQDNISSANGAIVMKTDDCWCMMVVYSLDIDSPTAAGPSSHSCPSCTSAQRVQNMIITKSIT